jgi:periplasmic protein TonB
MAYADQQISGNRIAAFIVVAILHIILIYALITGLAYDVVKKAVQRVTTVDIKEEVKKEPPPPPKKLDLPPPPPVVAPPPKVNVAPSAPTIQTVVAPPPAPPPPAVIVPPPPAAPPPPRFTPKGATPKGSGQGSWVTDADYPSRALREEREGVTGYRLTIGPDGKVADCSITSSSGSPDLDEAVCTNLRRRARFNAAMDGEGQPTNGTYSARVRWKIPKE